MDFGAASATKAAVLLGCALALTHCGGAELPTSPLESGVDDASDDGASDAEDELRAQCSFTACDGNVVYCPPPMACLRGDGCNVCRCTRASDNTYNINCTAHACDCVVAVKDGGK